MIMVSAWAARKMREHFQEWFPKTHWDHSLKRALEDHEHIREALHASYLFPSVGFFETRLSGTDGCSRETRFGSGRRWCQEGTRAYQRDHVHRQVRDFVEKGAAPLVCTAEIPEKWNEDLRRFTLQQEGPT